MESYLLHGNGTKAYMEAGYAGDADRAGKAFGRLLDKPRIQMLIQQITAKADVSPEEIKQKLAIGFNQQPTTPPTWKEWLQLTKLLMESKGMLNDQGNTANIGTLNLIQIGGKVEAARGKEERLQGARRAEKEPLNDDAIDAVLIEEQTPVSA